MSNRDVAIIGAGPYGLSVAAHLKAAGVNFRVFGKPMGFWRNHMPKGMHLKSEGFASFLYDPQSAFTLETYCKERGLPYADIGSPVPLEIFSAYGLEFQKRFVPNLEEEFVVSLRQSSSGFEIKLTSGEVFNAKRVVIAVGLAYFEHIPAELAALPKDFVTHSSKHHELDHFKGREVAIVGAGSSAIDLAALLHQAGASVQVIARVAKIRFQDPPDNAKPAGLDRFRNPVTGIGPGWKLWMCTNLPLVFRRMPESFRQEKVRKILGPAPCWFTKEQVVGKVGFNLSSSVTGAKIQNGRVSLELTDTTGAKKTLAADHVIAATGYKYDVQRLTFLDSEVLSRISLVGQTPALSANFETTVPNLFFVGVTAANTFGPLLRFAFGAGFAAPRISKHLARTSPRNFAQHNNVSKTESKRERESAEPVAR